MPLISAQRLRKIGHMPASDSDSPIFVVGAPRSGTSVLTWCLGQHPNILPTEESNWMGDFAISSAVAHAVGSLRGDHSQLSACGLSREDFLSAIGRAVNQLLLSQRDALLAHADRAGAADPRLVNSAIRIVRDRTDPKGRWIDGTPEYSVQMPALRSLFPSARFIHIVRDVRAVVKSLMLFRTDSHGKLVQTEREAIDYWLRCVRACLNAEKAWGPRTVLRVRYSDLSENSAATFARILDFLSEPFSTACLDPLSVRLNSSGVPADFDPRDPATDPAIRAEAEGLFHQLESQSNGSLGPDEATAAELARSFTDRVSYAQNLDGDYRRAQGVYAELEKAFEERSNWALRLEGEIAEKNARIVALQNQIEERSAWAQQLDQEVAQKNARVVELQNEVEERSAWAQQLHLESAAKDDLIAELRRLLEETGAAASKAGL